MISFFFSLFLIHRQREKGTRKKEREKERKLKNRTPKYSASSGNQKDFFTQNEKSFHNLIFFSPSVILDHEKTKPSIETDIYIAFSIVEKKNKKTFRITTRKNSENVKWSHFPNENSTKTNHFDILTIAGRFYLNGFVKRLRFKQFIIVIEKKDTIKRWISTRISSSFSRFSSWFPLSPHPQHPPPFHAKTSPRHPRRYPRRHPRVTPPAAWWRTRWAMTSLSAVSRLRHFRYCGAGRTSIRFSLSVTRLLMTPSTGMREWIG